jgi:hypothetical protein
LTRYRDRIKRLVGVDLDTRQAWSTPRSTEFVPADLTKRLPIPDNAPARFANGAACRRHSAAGARAVPEPRRSTIVAVYR